MTDPTNPPLWRVMDDAYGTHDGMGESYANMLRAIAEEMPVIFDPWLQEHGDVADWLRTEADRAEAGE